MAETRQTNPEREDGPSAPEQREWHLQDALWVLYKRRWAAAATFLVVVAAATVKVLTTTPIYEARAQLLVSDRASVVSLSGVVDEPVAGDSLETHSRLLQSRSLARRVIDELGLWDEATAAPEPPGAAGRLRAYVAERWNRMRVALSGSPSVPSSPAEAGALAETLAESRVIDRLLRDLHVSPIGDTRILEVRYESPDPQLAARVVSTLIRAYADQNLEARSSASAEASRWLADQLAEQRQRVQQSELALQKYREQKDSLSLEAGQNIVVQRLNAMNASATQAKTERIAAESLYRQLAGAQGDHEALDTFAPIRANPRIQQLKARLADLRQERLQLSANLGARHPEMMRLDAEIASADRELSTETSKTVESVRQDYLAAASREQELTAALDTQKASALALNRQAIEYGVLLREVESNRQIYQSLLQRANETAVSGELRRSNVDVLDAPEVPRAPVRPDTQASLLIALLVACVLTVGMVGALEVLDTRIQTPEDVAKALGLPFLGMLPHVSERSLSGGAPLLSSGVPAVYAEACRSLRTNLLAATDGQGHRSLLVTSAAPGDGKSVVAVNLATLLGRSGRRVLLVDADLRRPALHELLNAKQTPGLSEILAGKRKPSEVVAASRFPGVWILSSGSCPSNPSELVGSRRFQELLEKLQAYFDWVIVDSPPVMAVTDPAVIARLASGVLFVVNAKRSRRRVAQAALDRLETAGASFAGAVLNSISLDRDHYYNARYYLPFYGDYLNDRRSA